MYWQSDKTQKIGLWAEPTFGANSMRNSLVVEFRVLLELSNNTLTDLITNSLDYPVELSFFHKMALVLLLCSPSRARDQTSCRTQSSSSSRRPPPPPRSWRPTPLPPGNTTTACSPATRPPAALALAVFDCGATPLACATDVVGALSCEAARLGRPRSTRHLNVYH